MMQTFTFSLGSLLRRLSARNPLVRVSDRLEATTLLIVFAVALFAAPVAGAVGTGTYDNVKHAFAVDRINSREVSATVTAESTLAPRAYEDPFLTPIQWQFEGAVHTGQVRTTYMKTGDRMTIWIDTKGDRKMSPLTDQDAATQAILAALGLWFAAVVVAIASWAALRARLDRSRHAAWDRELHDLLDGGRRNQPRPHE
jgi:hypothetical protein